MLIYIDDSVVDQLKKNNTNAPDYDVLEDLARARKNGIHFLLASRETLKYLAKSHGLSPRGKAIYQKLYNELPQSGSLRSKFSRYLVLQADHRVPDRVVLSNDQQEIRLPISEFYMHTFMKPPLLLAENIKDAIVFQHVGETFIARHFRGAGQSIQIRCEPRGGGGDQTADEYQAIQGRGDTLCICVVDSDKDTPTSPPGNTANRVRKAENPSALLTEHHIIGCRYVENLIPFSYLNDHFCSDYTAQVFFLEAVLSTPYREAALYFNMKDGVTHYELHNDCERFTHYWTEVLKAVGIQSPDTSCESAPQCTSRQSCQCLAVKGFGSRLLESFLRILPRYTGHHTAERLSTYLESEWDTIGEIIAAWCCAGQQIRS